MEWLASSERAVQKRQRHGSHSSEPWLNSLRIIHLVATKRIKAAI